MSKRLITVVFHICLFFIFIFSGTLCEVAKAEQKDTKDELVIAFLADITGPMAFWNSPRIVGIQDAIEYINQEFGGIGGRKVRLEWRDQKSNAALAEKGYKELRSFNPLIWHTCGTGEQQLLKSQYEKDKSQIIFTCSTSPGVIYPVGHVFGTAAYYPDQFGVFIDWLVETWDKKKMGRMPRVAFITYSSGYGRAAITPESMEYAEKKGVKIVDTIYVPHVTRDPLTPLLQVKKAGADWIFSQAAWQAIPPYLVANKKNKLGLKFCFNTFGVDPVIVLHAGDAAEGIVGISNWYMPEEHTVGIEIVKKNWAKKSRPPEDRGTAHIIGWMNMWQTKMALEQTLERVGNWNKVTPKEIMTTLENWGEQDIYGFGKLKYSPTERGAESVRIVQVKNGQWMPVTDWRKAPNLVPSEWRKKTD